MKLAYARGPPVAVFAGSWRCTSSPIDGVPIALGEPFGDCGVEVARLISIATTVRLARQMGIKVYVSAELGEEGLDAAFAGGADGVLEELSFSRNEYVEGVKFVVLDGRDVADIVNTVRSLGERFRKPFDVLVATSYEFVPRFASLVDGVVITGGWVDVEVAPVEFIPEVGRCVHCGVDYLMYSGSLKRCIYCGRRLLRVVTATKTPRSRAVYRSVYKKFANITTLRFKIV
ncbi:hypothetical protein ODS41_03885 [Pyrobaculum sp. 3827-6]|uniref:hypothetical protein n=1 Tax=Pyrobaculum sp. 3827-6 TaxID=2983604 RepID=UPI0021DB5368|nr:hypothetical protein [Pyrobaculum sp. 3827-6]MCU7787069.1 hypothetical protein [Pyrobaculum sp. 3827-6]